MKLNLILIDVYYDMRMPLIAHEIFSRCTKLTWNDLGEGEKNRGFDFFKIKDQTRTQRG
jgi:hypothetical protein